MLYCPFPTGRRGPAAAEGSLDHGFPARGNRGRHPPGGTNEACRDPDGEDKLSAPAGGHRVPFTQRSGPPGPFRPDRSDPSRVCRIGTLVAGGEIRKCFDRKQWGRYPGTPPRIHAAVFAPEDGTSPVTSGIFMPEVSRDFPPSMPPDMRPGPGIEVALFGLKTQQRPRRDPFLRGGMERNSREM